MGTLANAQARVIVHLSFQHAVCCFAYSLALLVVTQTTPESPLHETYWGCGEFQVCRRIVQWLSSSWEFAA